MDNIKGPLKKMYREILLKFKKRLDKGGKIIYYSFYRSSEEKETVPLINKESSFEWIKERGDFKVSKIYFKGILNGEDTISILTTF